MNGKGSTPRPLAVSRDEFDNRWRETFEACTTANVLTPEEENEERWVARAIAMGGKIVWDPAEHRAREDAKNRMSYRVLRHLIGKP